MYKGMIILFMAVTLSGCCCGKYGNGCSKMKGCGCGCSSYACPPGEKITY